MTSRLGQVVGSIRLDRELGRGGMGEVYAGFDLKLERRVAVKTIRAEKRFVGEMKLRFLREARILSKLGHPGICQVYDWIETPDADFLVMEFVDGRTLLAEIAQGIDVERLLKLFMTICVALDAAHRQRIVHRDLKPDNLMVLGDEVKILDFGIARAEDALDERPGLAQPMTPLEQNTSTTELIEPKTPVTEQWPLASGTYDSLTGVGSVIGTRRYMSPEQAAGGTISSATDIYALGVTLEDALEAAQSQASARSWRIDPALSVLLLRMKAVDPSQRPSALQVRAELASILDAPRQRRRRRLLAWLAAGIGVALIALAATLAYLAWAARAARADAEQRREQAEALVDFMLGDLRSKLSEVGRLDLLKDVNERALAHFAAIPAERQTAADVAARIKLLTHLADVAMQVGDAAAAERWILQAAPLAERSATLGADDIARLQQLAEIENWLGYIAGELARPPDTVLDHFRNAADYYRQIAARLPDDASALGAHASAVNNLGASLANLRHWPQAHEVLTQALQLRREALAKAPAESRGSYQAILASTLGWLSSANEALFRLPEAIAARTEAVELLRQSVAADPANRPHQADLAVALRYAAGLHELEGETHAAAAALAEARALSHSLVDFDQENASWQRMLALIDNAHAGVLMQLGDTTGAARALDAAEQRLEALVQSASNQSDWLAQLRMVRLQRIEWLIATGESNVARAATNEWLASPDPLDTAHTAQMRLALIRLALAGSENRDAMRLNAQSILQAIDSTLLASDFALASQAARLSLAMGCGRSALLDRIVAAGNRSKDLQNSCRSAGLDCSSSEALSRAPLATCAALRAL